MAPDAYQARLLGLSSAMLLRACTVTLQGSALNGIRCVSCIRAASGSEGVPDPKVCLISVYMHRMLLFSNSGRLGVRVGAGNKLPGVVAALFLHVSTVAAWR